MFLSEFDFELPAELIAQKPAEVRTASRMMMLNRADESVRSGQFSDLNEHLQQGDLLVLNDTQVIPARLIGKKETGGRIEVFLVRRLAGAEESWACLTKSSKTVKPGVRLIFSDGLEGTVLTGGDELLKYLHFTAPGVVSEVLDRVGRIPLPPYIEREPEAEDRDRYQTVFACNAGALAAPTAGLHFSQPYLDSLRRAGVDILFLTLHVGLGTFLPIRTDNVAEHQMHAEEYTISESTAQCLNRARDDGRRIVAVGTTVARALESAFSSHENKVLSGTATTQIFIRPGYTFKVIDALLTNFHLPRSTLLMLVSAFAGKEFILSAYEQAVRERFRFFSYGDCMFIQ
ncbi:MAG: tRNA preQ1(34) S-adenosylmethionine ribosyltransferase-isomerase QueA [Desulfuromonadales bacterium]|nr:tRNA preQ1(34) S-adenosylmethionine ribosyltransferase-isomerase QueA [Desulfuromonadales bacterium]